MKKLLLLLIITTITSINIFGQAIPKQIDYQGVLKTSAGLIVPDGNYPLTFKIYNDPTGGTALWSETQTVAVANGIFSAHLGSTTPITTVPFDRLHFLGITLGTEPELLPRTMLTPSPYSFMSMNVLDNSITTNKLQDGSVTGIKIGNNEVVKNLNGLKDNVNLVAGTNITITPSGNNLTIAAAGGGSGTIGGSGTANYLPVFTNETTLGNSNLFQNAGGNIQTGLDGTGKSLILSANDNNVEGGQINWNGAGDYDDWEQDSYINSMRFYTNSTSTNTFEIFNVGTGLANLSVEGAALINGLTIGRGNGNVGGNSAFGYQALYSNTTGYMNTANGYEALKSNTTGDHNTANGFDALYSNTTGYRNTANGYGTLGSNTTGYLNTANGMMALSFNTEGSYNTAHGTYALYHNNTQNDNTAVGSDAGGIKTFSEGTFLGVNAYPNSDGYTNIMGLGYAARPDGSNQVHIGNTSITSIQGHVSFTTFSDGRYKTSIQENVKGLDFIIKLRPITYQLDVNRLASDLKEDQKRDENGNIIIESLELDIKSRNEKSQIVYTGFVAQEVETAAKELGYDFSGVDAPQNENGTYGLRYAEFVVPLVKAIQEQQKKIEELTKRIEELERK